MHFFRSFVAAVLAVSFGVASAHPAHIPGSKPSHDEVARDVAERSTSAYRTGGQGTYYYPGMGACGWHNKNTDMIVAISTPLFKGKHCGKTITITANGKTHTAEVVDECPDCATNSLDMSPSLFKVFAPESAGVISMKWKFN
ncbi:hypothetical protein DL93DRAFT_2084205 [Clavulina sp. PMI_390]|nr:hypothetical protein DL93DRAFT_2084205 [Clavulina sp. PMI_390]